MSVATLCESTLQAATKEFGSYAGREASLLGNFRLRREFHEDLLAILATARDKTKDRRTRATEKVAELVALARFVFPISRPDAEAFFNDAVAIAKEIDEEAIDQIAFVAQAARISAAASPGGDAAASAKLATFAGAASIRLEGHDGFSWDDVLHGLTWLHAPTAFACSSRWMDDGTARLRDTLPPLLLEAHATGQLTASRAAAFSILIDGPDTSLIKAIVPTPGVAVTGDGDALVDELARMILVADGQSARVERAKVLLETSSDRHQGYWLEHATQSGGVRCNETGGETGPNR